MSHDIEELVRFIEARIDWVEQCNQTSVAQIGFEVDSTVPLMRDIVTICSNDQDPEQVWQILVLLARRWRWHPDYDPAWGQPTRQPSMQPTKGSPHD